MSNELIQQAIKFYHDSSFKYTVCIRPIGQYRFVRHGNGLSYIYENDVKCFVSVQMDSDMWCLYSRKTKQTVHFPTLEAVLNHIFEATNE